MDLIGFKDIHFLFSEIILSVWINWLKWLFSLFLTLFLSHFEKSQKKVIYLFNTNKSEKKHNKVFDKKNQTNIFRKTTFFLLSFFSVSPNLANIRVDFAHNLKFLNFFVSF